MYTLKDKVGYSKQKILVCLVVISLISLGLKLYTVDFSSLPPEDTFGYVLRGFSHNNGDFTEPQRKTLGWSIVVSPFLKIIESDRFLDYVNVVRALSLGISTVSIFPMYLLARRFASEKYSLVAAFLFGIEPHLNHNAGLGLSEPLFILVMIMSAYFIMSKDAKLSYLSFFLAGIMWWIRFNGIVMLPILAIILFLNFRRSPKTLAIFLACISIFLIVSSPMLLQRYVQYGDPLYFSQSDVIYSGEFVTVVAENSKDVSYSASDYVGEHGIGQFIWKFIVGGLYNLTDQTIKLLFPYLIVLLPIGMFFSFRAFDQDPKNIRANWIIVLLTLGSFVTYFAVIQERRLLFHVLPFFIIFSIIPIQRLIEYGLSTFSLSRKQKDLALVLVLGITLILALSFTLRYELPDSEKENEKIELAKYLLARHEGKILDAGNTLEGLAYAKLDGSSGAFKNYVTKNDLGETKDDGLQTISLHAKSVEELILVGERYDLQYVAINKDEVTTVWYPFLEGVYDNDSSYPYLVQIIDSDDLGFEKLRVKVYRIDYQKFHEMNP